MTRFTCDINTGFPVGKANIGNEEIDPIVRKCRTRLNGVEREANPNSRVSE